jgi:NADPH2:quinone reductase
VLDPVGGVYGEAAVRALGWGGRFLVTGFASALPSLPANLMLLKSMDVLGVSWGEMVMRRPGMFRRHIRALTRLKASGAIRPAPSKILPIEEARSAIEALSGRVAMGKTVVRLSEARP